MQNVAACVCHALKALENRMLLSLAILLALVLYLPGCAQFFATSPQPPTAFDFQEPEYGSITHINYAASMDKGIHSGDLAISVELEGGGFIVIVQPQDNIYTVGDRVRVLRDGKGLIRAQIVQHNY